MSITGSVTQLFNAILNGPAVQLTRYPSQVIGVALAAAGAYAYKAAGANQAQAVAAGANTTGMWICGAGMDTPSAGDIYIVGVFRGTIPAGVLAGELQLEVVTDAGAFPEFHFPLPLFVRAGVGIAMDLRCASGVARTARGHVLVATGLGV